MKEITNEQALDLIGQALAHDSLKLSQKEHLSLVMAFNKIRDELKNKENVKEKGDKEIVKP